MQKITELIRNNKWRVFKIMFLLFVFFMIVAYVNGRNIYMEKSKQMRERTANISLNSNN